MFSAEDKIIRLIGYLNVPVLTVPPSNETHTNVNAQMKTLTISGK